MSSTDLPRRARLQNDSGGQGRVRASGPRRDRPPSVRKMPRPGFEPGTPRSKRGMISVSPSRRIASARIAPERPCGREGIRTLISLGKNRVSTTARPTVSGSLPFVSELPCRTASGLAGTRTRISSMPCWHLPFGRRALAVPGGGTSDRSGGRTHRITRLSTWPLFQFAYSVNFTDLRRGGLCETLRRWPVRGSHPASEAYETPLGTGPPAMCRASVDA